jgi:transaldolase
MVPEILSKLDFVGKDLDAYSLETVNMFYRDACAANYQIDVRREATVLSV